MAAYNAWANARLYAMAHALPDEQYRKNVGAFFGSLHGTWTTRPRTTWSGCTARRP